jgi:hypothetical protein
MNGPEVPHLQRLATRILAQTVSSSPCERNWSTFSLIHTKQRNRLGYQKLQKLVYCHYNMKLKLREELPGHDKNSDRDPLDLLQMGTYAFVDPDSTRDDPTYQWVKPSELDTEASIADPGFVQRAQELGLEIDLDAAQSPVGGDEFDALVRGRSPQPTPPIAKRRNVASTSQTVHLNEEEDSGDDDDNNNDDDDDDDNDDDDGNGTTSGGGATTARTSVTGSEADPDISLFTEERTFDHATQDEDHGSRQQHDSTTTKQFSRRKKRGEQAIWNH